MARNASWFGLVTSYSTRPYSRSCLPMDDILVPVFNEAVPVRRPLTFPGWQKVGNLFRSIGVHPASRHPQPLHRRSHRIGVEDRIDPFDHVTRDLKKAPLVLQGDQRPA